MTTEKPKRSKPKRTLVQIRAEKQALREQIEKCNLSIILMSNKTPHAFLKTASYNQVLEYKEAMQKQQPVTIHPKDSTKMLAKKLDDARYSVAKIEFYLNQ